MPWLHVPDALLGRFVAGDLHSDLHSDDAMAVANHLDDCAICQARVAALDPLAQAFASVDDPVTPPQLMAQVVEHALGQHQPTDTTIPAVGAGLAVAAMAVLVLTGAPGELLGGLQALGSAFGAVLRAVEIPVAVITPIWAAAAMFTFAAAAVATRRLELGRAAWR